MITLSLLEVLYIVLILCVVLLTVYLLVTLTRLNTILRDVQSVSKVLAKVGGAVDQWGNKAAAGVMGLLHYFASKADDTRKKGK